MGQLTQNESKNYLGMEGLGAGEKKTLTSDTGINWTNVRNKLTVALTKAGPSYEKVVTGDWGKICNNPSITLSECIDSWMAAAKGLGAKNEAEAMSEQFLTDHQSELWRFCPKKESETEGSGWSMPTWGYFAIVALWI